MLLGMFTRVLNLNDESRQYNFHLAVGTNTKMENDLLLNQNTDLGRLDMDLFLLLLRLPSIRLHQIQR